MDLNLDPEELRFKDDVLFLAGGDHDLALDLLVRCHAISCNRISAGYARAGAVAAPRFLPKAKVEAIDIPSPTSPLGTSPSS
jgi:hypothetical protein